MTKLAVENRKALRVLLVEDQMIIALEIEDMLQELGCAVVGPVRKLESAIQLAREAPLDAAILDVDLDGIKVFPVAEEIQARGIPFIFSTGYGESTLPTKWRGAPRLAKPFRRKHLENFIRSISSS